MSNPNVSVNGSSFKTKTQFDNSFDKMFKDYPQAKKGTACFVFALTVAQDSMRSEEMNQEQYQKAINRAIAVVCMTHTKSIKSFNEALQDTNIKGGYRTHADVLATYDPRLTTIIPDISHGTRCSIIKKSGMFFAVVIDSVRQVYNVRDVNKSTQYDFTNRTDLIAHLKKNYFITEPVIIDGQVNQELSKVEYIIIKDQIIDNYDSIINKIMFGENDQNVFLGIVNNPPPDDEDIDELQKRFGGDPDVHAGLRIGDVGRNYLFNENPQPLIPNDPIKKKDPKQKAKMVDDDDEEYVEEDPRYMIRSDGDDSDDDFDNLYRDFEKKRNKPSNKEKYDDYDDDDDNDN